MEDPLEIPFFLEHEPEESRVEDTIPLLFSGIERQPDKDEVRAWVLWPAFHYVREGRSTEVSLLNIPFYRSRVDHRGFQDLDVLAGPAWFGHSVDEGWYFTLWPLGGTLKGILGKDRVVLVTPLIAYTEDKAFKSLHAPFPIFNLWWGGGRSGFRVFPLFAHYTREDVDGRLAYRRTWILWPLFQRLENNLNSPGGAQTMTFFFPFVGWSDGPDTHQWTVLYPFFKYHENRGTAYGGPLWDFRFWPFLRLVRGRNRTITDFWPFYGEKERGTPLIFGSGSDYYWRRFILWPVWREEEQTLGDVKSDRWWFLNVWSFRERHAVEGWKAQELKVWPLFRYKRWKDGRQALNILSPLWFRDPEGAFERIYGPLTRVYHEWRDEEGARRMEVLFGLYGERDWRTREGEDVARTSLLFGLVQYERRKDRKLLRFFYLPTGVEWGEGAAPPPREPDDGWEPAGRGGQRTPG